MMLTSTTSTADRGTMVAFSSTPTTCCTQPLTGVFSVCKISSGLSGASYAWSIPVKPATCNIIYKVMTHIQKLADQVSTTQEENLSC